jgi:hypothetical protein
MVNPALGWWLGADAPGAFRVLTLSPAALDSLARRRLGRLLVAAAGTGFYRRRLEAAGMDARDPRLRREPERVLAALAPVSKSELREAGASLLSGGRVSPSWMSSASSGSTGEPFRVYYDARAWATLKHLVKLRARVACGLRPAHRVALLDAIPPAPRSARARVARISVFQQGSAIAAELARSSGSDWMMGCVRAVFSVVIWQCTYSAGSAAAIPMPTR